MTHGIHTILAPEVPMPPRKAFAASFLIALVACSSTERPQARPPPAGVGSTHEPASARTPAPVASSSAAPPGGVLAAPPSSPPAPSDPAGPDPRESKEGKMAVDAVAALPGVQGMCADAKKRGAAGCVFGVDEAPTARCGSATIGYENRSCWWAVGLMEVMQYPGGAGDHANRVATFYVEPGKLQVVAASSFACGDLLFTLPSFRRLVMGTAKSTPDDPCPGAIPYPVPPPP